MAGLDPAALTIMAGLDPALGRLHNKIMSKLGRGEERLNPVEA